MGTGFATERNFSPLLALKEYGKEARGRMVSSELDLPSSTHSRPLYLTSSPILAMLSLGVLGSARPAFRQWMTIK